MTTIAIICEFNPFHNGHKYLIDEARNRFGADFVVCIMSGNFVQRGEPAICDKMQRAEMAVKCGADAVLELPVVYATSSAPDFAFGGVAMANSLGCIDYLLFGSETGEIVPLQAAADFLENETEEFKTLIKTFQKEGLSYPAAVSKALKDIEPGLADIIEGPNNTLAIEYLRALKRLNSKIKPITVKRMGNEHNSMEPVNSYASASLIRKNISDNYHQYMPIELSEAVIKPIIENDFSVLLSDKIEKLDTDELCRILGANRDIILRIKKKSPSFKSFTDFLDETNNRSITRAALSRILIHILLDINSTDLDKETGPAYLRLLALNKSSSVIVKKIKEHSSATVISKLADFSYNDNTMLLRDIYATNLYRKVYSSKYNSGYKNDIATSPIIV